MHCRCLGVQGSNSLRAVKSYVNRPVHGDWHVRIRRGNQKIGKEPSLLALNIPGVYHNDEFRWLVDCDDKEKLYSSSDTFRYSMVSCRIAILAGSFSVLLPNKFLGL